MNNAFIDVYYNHNDRLAPYQANVWQCGQVVERVSYRYLDETVAFCKQRKLPVVANNSTLLFLLHARGIDAQSPDSKSLGGFE